MKRGEIAVLAVLSIILVLGAVGLAEWRVIAFLVLVAMEPTASGCDEGPYSDASSANARGDVVALYSRACTGISTVVDYSTTLQLHGDDKWAKLVEHSDLRHGYPKFHWIDDDTLMIDLGKVRWVTQKTGKVGSIHITYVYSKGE
ncbi:MAG: hypothetical protein ACREQC_14140 [Candidatus Binataceae bacterium]